MKAVLAAVYFLLAGALGFRVAVHETEISHLIDQIASRQDLNHVTNADVNLDPSKLGVVTSFFLRISQKDIVSRQQAAENQHQLLDAIGQLKAEIRASTGDSLALVGVTIAYLATALMWFGAGGRRQPSSLYPLLAVSLIFFAIGIACPVLTAVVKGEHLLIGGFIIQTASKGIVSTVVSLFKSGSWILSLLLAGFSIGIPLFKGVAVLLTSLSPSRERRRAIGRALESIGKWSLTDVVVAAVLLGCFSLNAIRQPNGGVYAVPRFAFGFFILYCALAARTSYLLRRSGESAKAPDTPAAPLRVAASALLLALGLGAGVAAGAKAHVDVPWRQVVSEPALLRLIRTHTELVHRRFHSTAGRTTEVPLDLPFAGTLTLEADGRGDHQVEIGLETEMGGRLPAFDGPPGLKISRSGRLPAGHYQLLIEPQSGRFLTGGASVDVKAALDP